MRVSCRDTLKPRLASVTGRSTVGQRLGDVFPHLAAVDLTITEDITESVDVVFSALPHHASAERLGPFVESGVRAIDISADYRLKDLQQYEEWYGEHPHPSHVEDAVYGLPELHRDEVAGRPSGRQSGLLSDSLDPRPRARDGIGAHRVRHHRRRQVGRLRSGQERGRQVPLHRGERKRARLWGRRTPPHAGDRAGAWPSQRQRGRTSQCDLSAPSHPDDKRHPSQLLRQIQGRGVLLRRKRSDVSLMELYRDFFADHPFVHVTDEPPSTKQTLGNNDCRIYPTVDRSTGRLVAVGCIDNLVKGAAGQAVQNMNIMFGMPEHLGLEELALYP